MTDDARYEEARQRVQAKKAFFTHAAVYVVINVVFLIVAGWSWLWVTLFWGLGLAIQGVNTFFSSSGWFKGWEDRQIQKELARGSAGTTPPAAPPASGTDTTKT